jgi:hypothetical protein
VAGGPERGGVEKRQRLQEERPVGPRRALPHREAGVIPADGGLFPRGERLDVRLVEHAIALPHEALHDAGRLAPVKRIPRGGQAGRPVAVAAPLRVDKEVERVGQRRVREQRPDLGQRSAGEVERRRRRPAADALLERADGQVLAGAA